MPHRASHIFSAVFALAFLAFACDRAPNHPDATGAAGAATQPSRQLPLLVATTPMVGDVVSAVAGAHAKVVVLIGPGVDPHLWTPTRTDVLEILDADAVFLNGLMLEGRVGDSFARVETAGRPVLRLAQSIDRKELLTDPKRASYFDPHVWMDVAAWANCLDVITEGLSKSLPEHATEFQTRAVEYRNSLQSLHEYGLSAIDSIPESSRVLVTSHDAFNYFGRAYNIEVLGVQGLSTESEAGLQRINELVDLLVERKVPAVFVESSVPQKNILALIDGAKSRGHDVKIGGELFSDAMGAAGTYEGTYLGMLDHNITTVARALGGTAPERGPSGKLKLAKVQP